MRGGSFWRRDGGAKIVRVALLALVVVGAVTALLVSRDSGAGDDRAAAGPDPFYAAPDPLPAGGPGAILRSARLTNPPAGTLGFKLLYRSRSYTGKPTALSAVLIVPASPAPSSGRNVVAATHGTVGVASRCAPSEAPASWATIPGAAQFVRDGHAVVVPDFEGLGTPGPHPYLVGDAAAWATLDAVRAVALFRPAGASRRFVVWGPGQGGHAALFAGQRAARYAPELELAGVAAAAPLTDLQRILELSRGETAGRVMAAYVLAAWSRSYAAQIRLDDVVSPAGRRIVENVADACVALDTGPIPSAVGQAADALTYLEKEPFRAASLRALLTRNTPGAANLPAPVFITQGTRDGLVPADVTKRFVRRLCSRGVRVRYRVYRRVAHRDAAPSTASDVASWIAERFAGAPARTSCR